MVAFGYALSSEEHGPLDLVRNAQAAEDAGFEFASISDHFHPWLGAQGHSPFVWSVLGALATSTGLDLGVGVTCPLIRVHPAIVAHAAATVSVMAPGRFFLGVGTGEALNEHVHGDRWPAPEVRLSMLEEAVAVMRALWSGETVDHWGDHYTVENARLFDAPASPVPVIVSAFGPKAAELAARIGDGYWGTSPSSELLSAYADAGGSGPRYGQASVCWATTEDEGAATVHRQWANTGVPGQLSQDLPTWTHFEQVASLVTEDSIRESSIPMGPDVGRYVDSVRSYVDAGFTHVYFQQIGPDQAGFLRFWQEELAPALGSS
jgi:G6PDH family F420-dependent oxidoreductase